MQSLFLIVLLLFFPSFGECSSLPLEELRVWPISGMVLSSGQNNKLSIGFNQPIQEAAVGQLSIHNAATNELLFQSSTHSPYITVSAATVNINLPIALDSTEGLTTYTVSVQSGSYVSVIGANPSPLVVWQFHVSSERVFFNSSIPAELSYQTHIQPLLNLIDPQRLQQTIETLSSAELFGTRFFQSSSGRDAATWLAAQYSDLLRTFNSNGTIQFFQHSWIMPSLIVRLPGRIVDSPIIVLGAHLDSINRQNYTANKETTDAPGADDDASGIAIQLELFRLLVSNQIQTNYQLEFHAYSAEEEGLYGSAEISAAYQQKQQAVAAMLQLDQCGWVNPDHPEEIALFVDNTDPVLNAFTLQVLKAYTSIPTVLSDEAGRADSDFHSWTNCGYRASYFAEGPVDDIVYGNDKHSPWDRLSGVSIPHVQQIARGALGFILELAQIN